jgi:hypothetical protein
MNTYGLLTINVNTFNTKKNSYFLYSSENRDALITILKAHNLTLNVLGYIPGISIFSGSARIGSGFFMCAASIAFCEQSKMDGWRKEALLTGVTQLTRGTLEAFVPFGQVVNAYLDAGATVYNLAQKIYRAFHPLENSPDVLDQNAYSNPDYAEKFWLLRFV